MAVFKVSGVCTAHLLSLVALLPAATSSIGHDEQRNEEECKRAIL